MKLDLVKNIRPKASFREKLFAHIVYMIGNIKITWRKPRLSKHEYSRTANILKPGDLVFVGTKREMSRFFLRGNLTHSLIYIGRKKFIHAEGKYGVGGIYLHELFDKYDFLKAYRCKTLSAEKIKKMMDFLLKSYGKAYDFRFLENNKNEFYCTRLVELTYREAGVKINKKHECDIPYISTTHPEDFILKDFEEVFVSESLKKKKELGHLDFWHLFAGYFDAGW